MPSPENVLLIPPEHLPPRTTRSLRRKTKHRIITPTLEAYDRSATHVLHAAPRPSLSLLCAIASAGNVKIVDEDVNDIEVSDDVLPACQEVLWMGRVWMGAYNFWRRRGKRVFEGCEVMIVGEVRPKCAAGVAAPNSYAVREILLAGGADVVDDVSNCPRMSFAIVAAGKDGQTCTIVSSLLKGSVLCLGCAFVIDVVARVRANVMDYLLFGEQRGLCAGVLSVETIGNDVLQVAKPSDVPGAIPSPPHRSVRDRTGPASVPVRMRVRQEQNACDSVSEEASVEKQAQPPGRALSCETPTQGIWRTAEVAAPHPATRRRTRSASRISITVSEERKKVPKRSRRRSARLETDSPGVVLEAKDNTSKTKTEARRPEATKQQDHLASGSAAAAKSCGGPDLADGTVCEEEITGKCIAGGDSRVDQQALTERLTRSVGNSDDAKRKRVCPRTRRTTRSQASSGNTLATIPKKKDQESDNPMPASGDLVELDSPTTTAAEEPTSSPKMMDRKLSEVSWAVEDVTSAAIDHKIAQHPPKLSVSPTTPPDEVKDLKRNRTEGANEDNSDAVDGDGDSFVRKRRRRQVLSCLSRGNAADDAVDGYSNRNAIRELDFKSPMSKPTDQKLRTSMGGRDGRGRSSMVFDPDADAEIPDLGRDESLTLHHVISRDHSTIGSIANSTILTRGGSRTLKDNPDLWNQSGEWEGSGERRDTKKSLNDSVEESYGFLIERLGGEPEEKDLDRLLLWIRTGSQDPEGDNPNQEEYDLNEIYSNPGAPGENSPTFEDEDEFVAIPDGGSQWGRDSCLERHGNDDEDDPDILVRGSQRTRGGRLASTQNTQRGSVNAFKLPIPTQPITLNNIVPPRFASLEQANMISTVVGNSEDDHTCQDNVDYSDWILGAENLVGFSEIEGSLSVHSGFISSCRRVWLSVFESGVMNRLGLSGGLGETEIIIMTGVCMRLLSCDIGLDTSARLVGELLSIRDKQLAMGFDSLQIFLSSRNVDVVPIRHRAIATIWTSLINGAVRDNGAKSMWKCINKAISTQLEGMFSGTKVNNVKLAQTMDESLNSLLQSLVAVGYMFAVRLDLYIDEGGPIECDTKNQNICPENWQIISECVDKLCELSKAAPNRDQIIKSLISFIRSVTINLAGKTWPVTEELLSCTCKAITFISASQNRTCFCLTPALFASRFRNLGDINSGRVALESNLKTLCDCNLFQGWLYTTQDGGNAMKRAMNFIRTNASFTRGKQNAADAAVCSINHHAGLFLTVADSMVSATKDGESLICRMLTSKCPRLEDIVDDGAYANTAICDRGWRSILEAISERIRILIAKRDSVEVYTDWLFQHVVNNFCHIRKTAERSRGNVAHREAMRVRDSVFSNLAMHAFKTLTNAFESLKEMATDDFAEGRRLIPGVVAKGGRHVPTLARFASDIVSQVGGAGDGAGMSKNRHVLLSALLNLMEEFMSLVLYLLRPLPGGMSVLQKYDRAYATELMSSDENVLGFAQEKGTEGVILSVLSSMAVNSDPDTRLQARRHAGQMLSHIVELRYLLSPGSKTDGELQALLHRAAMDVSARYETGALPASATQRADICDDERARLAFWSRGVHSSWYSRLVLSNIRLQVMALAAALGCLTTERKTWSRDEQANVESICEGISQTLPLADRLSTSSSPQDDGSGVDLEDTNVLVVEETLRRVAVHWPNTIATGLLRYLMSICIPHLNRPRCADRIISLYAFFTALHTQLVGFSSSKRIHTHLETLTHALTLAKDMTVSHVRHMQRCVISTMAMIDRDDRDVEIRVRLLRLLNARESDMCGVWRGALLPTRAPDLWLRRARRNEGEWISFVWLSAVEHIALARGVAPVVNLVVAAVRSGGDAVKELVKRFVERVGDRGGGRGWEEVLRYVGR